jgi:hypothetical protein
MMQIVANNVPDCSYACSLKIGFRLIVFWSFLSLLLLVLAIFYSHRMRLHSKRGSLYKSINKYFKPNKR